MCLLAIFFLLVGLSFNALQIAKKAYGYNEALKQELREIVGI